MFAYSPFFLNIKTMDIINFLEQDASDILMLPFTFKEWQVKPLTVAQVIAINHILSKIVLDDIGDLESSLKDGKIENLISFQIKYAKQVNDVVTTIIGAFCQIFKNIMPIDPEKASNSAFFYS